MMTSALGWLGLFALSMVPGIVGATGDPTVSSAPGPRAPEVAPMVARRLRLQVHPLVPIAEPDIDAVIDEVARIWAPYGFDVTWSDTAPPVVADRDLFLQVVIGDDGPPGDSVRRALSTIGWIEFLGPGRPRDVVHVSTSAATRLMQAARLLGRPLSALSPGLQSKFMVQALGRSLAHEIGHYLFATMEHAESGLMREAFSPDELIIGELDDYRLEAQQAGQLAGRNCARDVASGGEEG